MRFKKHLVLAFGNDSPGIFDDRNRVLNMNETMGSGAVCKKTNIFQIHQHIIGEIGSPYRSITTSILLLSS